MNRGGNMQQANVHDMAKRTKSRLRGKRESSTRPYVTPDMVRPMLDEEIVLNPLGRLTDHSVFDKLDEAGKQRYMLELAESYNRCLEKLKKMA